MRIRKIISFFLLIVFCVNICIWICSCKARIESGKNFTNSLGMEFIKLSTGYYVSKYETKQSDFEAIMGYNPSINKSPDNPVECLTADEAIKFCEKLTKIEEGKGVLPEGYVYALPTYKQWRKYVSNAKLQGSITPKKFSGMEVLSSRPVGSGEVNRLGIYDLRGNVAEFSSDLFHPDLYRGKGGYMILGASWNKHRDDFIAIRNRGGFVNRNDKSLDVGFRCILIKK